jgi:hypothetical protein
MVNDLASLSRLAGPRHTVHLWILIGNLQTYGICVTALWSYDYLLTLKDEVEYAWKTNNIFSE